jgi:ethanolamine ammonia-lyase small subunit
VALGQNVSTQDVLRFELDHARARDAIFAEAEAPRHATLHLSSQARNRHEYLRRPDLGRRLAESGALPAGPFDIAIVLGDGLSALALNRHADAVMDTLLPELSAFRLAPVIFARNARVALADEIGERLQASLSLILIGERPGLSSPDSLGAYFTWQPKLGRSDAERNCVSNIRPEGFPPAAAGRWIAQLVIQCFARQLSGVNFKVEAAKLE